MGNEFLNELELSMNGDGNVAFTENGAMAFASTKSAVLDFFGTGGALRARSDNDALAVFQRAFKENALLATKALFYFRDIRGGQGERNTFRVCLKWLAEQHPEIVRLNLNLISEYGRWDDLYVLVDTTLEDDVYALVKNQLLLDRDSERPSLLAKWLKSENTSSKKSRELARRTRQGLGLTSKQYRKMLSALRRQIGIVEQKISDNEWGAIEYDKIPSKAGLQYRNAFKRHDGARYGEFLDAVASGEKTINAGTLYPYEIVEKCGGYYDASSDIKTLDALWNALPNYFEGNEGVRGMVVADVSGSMMGRPMNVSVSLAIYTAERNTGPFAGKYITFTDRPKLVTVKEGSIADKVQQVMRTDVGYNTNVKAVFDMILSTAQKNKFAQEDLPTHLYMVSDMEFDSANGGRANERLFETIEREYADAGYKMPFLVFWNVNSRNDQQPMSMDKRGFQLVSGCSPSIFTSLLANKAVSAYELMLEVLGNERYAPVTVGNIG